MTKGEVLDGGVHLGVWIHFEKMAIKSKDGKLTGRFLDFDAGAEIEEVERFLKRCGIDRKEYMERYGDVVKNVLRSEEE